MRKRRLARAFGDEGFRDGVSPHAWGPGMRSQPICGCSEEKSLLVITLRNSYRVDWIIIVGHVTATLTPTAEGNDRSVRRNPVTDR
jgi:hypothetical protein